MVYWGSPFYSGSTLDHGIYTIVNVPWSIPHKLMNLKKILLYKPIFSVNPFMACIRSCINSGLSNWITLTLRHRKIRKPCKNESTFWIRIVDLYLQIPKLAVRPLFSLCTLDRNVSSEDYLFLLVMVDDDWQNDTGNYCKYHIDPLCTSFCFFLRHEYILWTCPFLFFLFLR